MGRVEIINTVFSFLGGGIVVALLDWLRTNRLEKRAQKISALRIQLQDLYGPLYFFTSQNELLLKLNEKILEGYQEEYDSRGWSHDEATHETLKKEMEQTIDVANDYVGQVVKNNECILEILRNSYAHIDPDDVELFTQHVLNMNRLKFETGYQGGRSLPFSMLQRMGSISIIRSEFIERVRQKFTSKKREVDRLVS
jgi:hypothetical protein